jgi:hypothetical protein
MTMTEGATRVAAGFTAAGGATAAATAIEERLLAVAHSRRLNTGGNE